MISLGQKTRGFTLVEMLATMALAGILMLALLSIIAALGRTREIVARHPAINPWMSEITTIVSQDLRDARKVQAAAGGVRIDGYGALDPVSLVRTHRPAIVLYAVQQAGACSVLIREQRTIDDRSGSQSFKQIVAFDVAQMSLQDIEWPKQARLVVQPSVADGPAINRVITME